MKVKIKNEIYDSDKEPIMLILSDMDKIKIRTMPDEFYKLCIFPKGTHVKFIIKFMHDDYKE